MRPVIVIAILSAGLAACSQTTDSAPPADASQAVPITSEAQFRQLVVDRTLINGAVSLTFEANGQFSGLANSSPYGGSWRWDGNAVCSTLGTTEDCETVTWRGTTATFTGAGQALTYTVLDPGS